MKRSNFGKGLAVVMLAWTMAILPVVSIGQTTRISMPKNKYKVQDDVKIGNEAAREVEKEFPILNDDMAQRYVEQVGQRLVAAIPPEFRQPAFNYRFKVVNASDINAFALPGGPMFVNRGMIEAAKNEGEMAGVMAHEMSHVALRHATAQQTKQGSVGNQLGTIGLILGGAILGGQTGAQIGAAGAQIFATKYSREYEKQADILGSHIMATAGYDPRDLANMFKTIEQTGGGGGPQWMSDHPNPGNRFEYINREAQYLRVSSNPIKVTRDFQRVQERLRSMPKARTMEQIQKDYKNGRPAGSGNPAAFGNYSNNVELPSTGTRVYSDGDWVMINVPNNWKQYPADNSSVQFAPEGAYGDYGITHGAMVGVSKTDSSDMSRATQDFVNSMLRDNSYLQPRTGYSTITITNRDGLSTVLAGRSPVTGKTEIVTIYTTKIRNGSLFYVATVSPEDESRQYSTAFRNMLFSIRLND